MTVTWLGHACFAVEQGGYTVIIDPYTDVRGYPTLKLCANEVLCSHGHHDHNYTAAVSCTAAVSPFTVEHYSVFHDEQQGALRGENTIHLLRADDTTLVHLGDLGHPLSAAQAAPLMHCDVLLIPVGGVYTIDAATAYTTVQQLQPRIVVPMHYRHDPYGLDNVAEAEDFLRRFPKEQVHRLSDNRFSTDMSGVLVPQYPV